MKHRILIVFFTLVLAGITFGQSSVTATHAAVDLPTYYGEYSPFCTSILRVNLPTGSWNVTSVDVEYIMTAISNGSISEQRSKLNCLQGTEEPNYFAGPISGRGQMPYSRSGLSIANGVHSGELTFELKAYRTFGLANGLYCDNAYYNYVDGEFWKVTVYYEPVLTCETPTALSETNITDNTVELSWMENGSAASWDIEYGATPYTFTGTPTVTGITKPYNLSNLLSSAEYTWKVRANCSTNTSDWSSSNTFTTACPIPTSLSETNITDNAAELSWNGSTTSWDIEYGATPYTFTGTPTATAITKPYNLSNLLSSTEYTWRVRSDCSINTSDWSSSNTFTTACPVPTTLSETNITDNAAELSWLENGLAASWDIEYGATPYTFTGTPTATGITNPYHLSNLLSSSEYTWKVRFDCSINTSDWSSSNTFTTACPVPTSLSETNITDNAAELSWNGSTTSWDIEYGATPYTFTGNPTATGITKPYNLSNLLSSTEYTWRVRSDCSTNTSDWSSSNTFTTACPIPTSLSETNITDDAAELSWMEIGSAASWDIEYGATPYTFTGTPTATGITNPYNLSNLLSSTEYTWKVRSDCSINTSDWSSSNIFTTACPVPTSLSEINITDTAADLSWNGSATSWDIEYGATPYTFTGTPTVTGITNPYHLSNLLYRTEYTWKVRSNCSSTNTSDWSSSNTFTTPLPLPISNWAILLGVFLMGTFFLIRYKR